jgi:hypothetical protein
MIQYDTLFVFCERVVLFVGTVGVYQEKKCGEEIGVSVESILISTLANLFFCMAHSFSSHEFLARWLGIES